LPPWGGIRFDMSLSPFKMYELTWQILPLRTVKYTENQRGIPIKEPQVCQG
jgi:hypothetical protein